MISGFGGSSRSNYNPSVHHMSGGDFPIPFNIPNVLHNLLFEDVGLEFDMKQKDILEALRFASNALKRFNEKNIPKEQKLKQRLFKEPDNEELKKEYEELQLDFFEANHHYKDLVVTISEMLTKEQYEQLLKFSNIPL